MLCNFSCCQCNVVCSNKIWYSTIISNLIEWICKIVLWCYTWYCSIKWYLPLIVRTMLALLDFVCVLVFGSGYEPYFNCLHCLFLATKKFYFPLKVWDVEANLVGIMCGSRWNLSLHLWVIDLAAMHISYPVVISFEYMFAFLHFC